MQSDKLLPFLRAFQNKKWIYRDTDELYKEKRGKDILTVGYAGERQYCDFSLTLATLSKAADLGSDKQLIIDAVTEFKDNTAKFSPYSIDGYMFSRSGTYLVHLINHSSPGVRYARGSTLEVDLDEFEKNN
jgi:hypothetical protein